MSAKHTPGPWVANTINAVEARIGESRREAGLTTGNTIVSTVADEWIALAQVATHCEGLKSGEGQANAHLIAAAPDLLVALKGAIEWMSCIEGHLRDAAPFKANLKEYKAAVDKAEATAP